MVQMAYRTFVDRFGAYWQVWDVRPDRVERRAIERRKRSIEWKGLERRTNERRRLVQTRTLVTDGRASGWLIFESLREKRCLNPVPKGWEKMSQEELRALWDKATPMAPIVDADSTVA